MDIQQTAGVRTGIRGWLILVAVGFVSGTYLNARIALGVFQVRRPFAIPVNIFIFLYDLLLILVTWYIAYLFFTKKALTPGAYLAVRLLAVTASVFFFVVSASDMRIDPVSRQDAVYIIIENLLGTLIFVPCFLFSKRVEVTFTKELKRDAFLDRLALPLAPALKRFYAALYKARRLFLVIILGCVALGFISGTLIGVLASYL